MEDTYDDYDLIKGDMQYLVRHTKASCFMVGEMVFLKSNPEQPMRIHSLDGDDDIICTWKSNDGKIQFHSFPPVCVLQYKYRCLIELKDKFKICLN